MAARELGQTMYGSVYIYIYTGEYIFIQQPINILYKKTQSTYYSETLSCQVVTTSKVEMSEERPTLVDQTARNFVCRSGGAK